jgi:hypothetical protein
MGLARCVNGYIRVNEADAGVQGRGGSPVAHCSARYPPRKRAWPYARYLQPLYG